MKAIKIYYTLGRVTTIENPQKKAIKIYLALGKLTIFENSL